MINQFIFLLYIGILGSIFIFLFKKRFDLINLYLLSLPVGLSLWVFMLLVLLVAGLPFNSFTVLLLSLSLLVMFIVLNFKYKNFLKKDFEYFFIFMICYSAAAVFFLSVNSSFFSNDSWRLLMGGKHIGLSSNLTNSMISISGVYSYVIHASSGFFGFDYLYAVYPLTAFSFFLFFIFNLRDHSRSGQFAINSQLYFCFISVLFLFSAYFVFFNAFYVHSNMLFGLFSFIALFGLWKRVKEKEKCWLIISTIALLSSCFLRIEGPLFSLIVIVILISRKDISFREKLLFFGPIFLFVSIWHIKIFFTFDSFSNNFLNSERILLILFLYFIALMSLLIGQIKPFNRMKENYPLIMLYILSIIWNYLILVRGIKLKGGVPVLRGYGELILNMVKNGSWGVTWIVLAVLFLAALALKRVNHESVFLYYIFSFGLLFNAVNLLRGGWREGWGDSGNRMLIHIIFILAFYVFLKFKNAFFPDIEENVQKT